jgi:hypothetical protein
VKHINIPENPMGKYIRNEERYKFVDGEWWYYYPETGTSLKSGNHVRERAITLRNRVDKVMRVNGKYISQSHPLYKAGNYKSFDDAAFSSLQNYEKSTAGEVYIITNPAWKGWVKVGMAIDSKDRCKGYQTSSPLRDFKLKFKKYFNDRRSAEAKAHALCSKKSSDRKGEWFKLDIKIAKDIINNMEVILND